MIKQRTQGNIVNDPIPIFPKEKDIFFNKESTWWYHFHRDNNNQVIGMTRDEDKLINEQTFKFHKLD